MRQHQKYNLWGLISVSIVMEREIYTERRNKHVLQEVHTSTLCKHLNVNTKTFISFKSMREVRGLSHRFQPLFPHVCIHMRNDNSSY